MPLPLEMRAYVVIIPVLDTYPERIQTVYQRFRRPPSVHVVANICRHSFPLELDQLHPQIVWRSDRSLRKTGSPRSSPELRAMVKNQFEMLPPGEIRTSKFCAPIRHCSDQPDIPFGRLDHVVEPACQYLLSETQRVILCRVERDVRRQRKRVGVDDGIDDNRSVLVG
jgi:hypothetical protein